MPLSCASSSHGEMFASWSSFVTTTSSPALHSRATVRVSAKFSVVVLAPKITSSAYAPRSSEAATRAASTTASLIFDVANAPPRFAFAACR